jgi:hypothetical protein
MSSLELRLALVVPAIAGGSMALPLELCRPIEQERSRPMPAYKRGHG